MVLFRILNIDPVDVVALVVCLVTLWWCVRFVPRRSLTSRLVLAGLGVLTASLGTRPLDAMISILFLATAIALEISTHHPHQGGGVTVTS